MCRLRCSWLCQLLPVYLGFFMSGENHVGTVLGMSLMLCESISPRYPNQERHSASEQELGKVTAEGL